MSARALVPLPETKRFGDIPKLRAAIFTNLSLNKARMMGFDPRVDDTEKLRQLFIWLGQLAACANLPARSQTWDKLTAIAALCAGWLASKGITSEGRALDVFAEIHGERVRQRELFQRGDVPYDVSAPDVDELLKLLTLGEEVMEVAKGIDELNQALARYSVPMSRLARRQELALGDELKQTAAVAVAWLESLEGRH